MTRTYLLALLLPACCAYASGPSDRVVTDPKSIASTMQAASAPVAVADVLKTVRMNGATLSPDDKRIAYISNAGGRPNLWMMNADGSGDRQLLTTEERQSDPLFTHDGQQIVYLQDQGGDELYDIYAVPVAGGEPKNVTKTDKVSESDPLFSLLGRSNCVEHRTKIVSRVTSKAANIFTSGL